MKQTKLIMMVALFGLLQFGSRTALAQHGVGGGPGGPHGPSASSHGAMNAPATDGRRTANSSSSAAPSDVLSHNSKLDSTLTTKLQAKNLLPAGTDLSTACDGFRNLGQCIAAIHVSHNLNLSFACLKADMIGQVPATGSNCPAGTGSSNKLSLGKSIQSLDPKANSGSEAKTGMKEADSDIQEAQSTT